MLMPDNLQSLFRCSRRQARLCRGRILSFLLPEIRGQPLRNHVRHRLNRDHWVDTCSHTKNLISQHFLCTTPISLNPQNSAVKQPAPWQQLIPLYPSRW